MTYPPMPGTQFVEQSNKSPQISHEIRKFCCTSQSMIIFLGCVIGMREGLIRKDKSVIDEVSGDFEDILGERSLGSRY